MRVGIALELACTQCCKCRHDAVVTLYGQASASESVLETTVLQNNYTAMVARGVLVLINTFCMHSGTDLQVQPAD